ncbi:MAG: hypothetical protein RL220_2100 [Bacteroidota bacterium]
MRLILPRARWSMPSGKGLVYLTFDDGPNPDITPQILDVLKEFDMRASFFLLGQQADKYPEIVERMRREGHTVGHHSYSHLSGWKTDQAAYLADVKRAADVIGGRLFRPPYGRITRGQFAALAKEYDVYMWSLMPGDFDPDVSADECLNRLVRHSRQGDIVVMHDNMKSAATVRQVLPKYLEYLRKRGWSSEGL